MRGSPFELEVPVGGWRTDIPLHRMPPNTLISTPSGGGESVNVVIDFDGLLKPRLGYTFIHNFATDPQLQVGSRPRLMGGISWTDSHGTVQIVIATLDQWWVYDGAGSFTALTPIAPPLDGDINFPTRFAQFGVQTAGNPPTFQGDIVYGCNGRDSSDVRKWAVGDATLSTAVDTLKTGSIDFLRANDMAVIGSRLVAINVDDGTPGPQRVRWSEVLDGTWWKKIAFNELVDGNLGSLIAIRATSRTSGVIYAERGQWIITAQNGTDASAFRFDRIQGAANGPVVAGPYTASSLVDLGGQHVFFGFDQHISVCDGQYCQSISQPIDAFLAARLAAGSGSSTPQPAGEGQRPVALYDPTRQRTWFFCSLVGDSGENLHAILYDQRLGGIWMPPQAFPDKITMAFNLLEQFGPTWDAPGIFAQSTLAADIGPGDLVIPLVDGSGFTMLPGPGDDAQAGVVEIGQETIAYGRRIGNNLDFVTRGAFGKLPGPNNYGFTTPAVHLAGTPVIQYFSWDTAPWASWDQIPEKFNPAMWIGTADGLLLRFFDGNLDNGSGISWAATWALVHGALDQEARVNAIDLQMTSNGGVEESYQLVLDGLESPYATPDLIFQANLDMNSPNFLPLGKGSGDQANLGANYLRLKLTGVASKNAPWIAGITLFGFLNRRPNPGGGVIKP